MTRLLEALHPEAVLVSNTWDTFEETIAALTDRLVHAGRLPPDRSTAVVELVCEREATSSTAMVDIGVSIPHARIEGIDGIVAALAAAPEGVYQRGDGLPISIMVLVLTSPQLSTEHLTFLSSLSMLLQSERVRQYLKEALSAREVLLLLDEYDR